MVDTVSFELNDVQHINFEDYEDDEFAIGKLGFLSTRPNSHELVISEDVLRECAPSALGKWLVAKMNLSKTDATSHMPDEQIMGIIPQGQDIEFVEDDDGYLRAYADVVISKIYAKDFCEIFSEGNDRAVSVEMKIETENGNGTEDTVNSFKIVGVTVLGSAVRPSCPQSNIEFVRFAEEAETCFDTHLAAKDKTYKIDKSKDSMSNSEWGEVDKTALRNKIMEASNRSSLVKSVYLLVEDGWEDAPSEHLKYPVMELKGDTFVYNRGGLSSALGYAEKENETSVVNKIKKIYKNLEIDNEGKEGESKMAEIEFAAVNIGDMWSKLYDALHAKYPEGDYDTIYRIEGIYEEGNKKFAVIRMRDEDALYRLDFTLTEDGLTLADEIIKVEVEIVETDEIRKFAEPEDVEKYRTFAEEKVEEKTEDSEKTEDTEAKLEETSEEEKAEEDKEEKEEEKPEPEEEKKTEMSADELMEKVAKLEADIAQRDNVIMEKDAELAELREYKKACMTAEKTAKVEAVMAEYSEFMDEKTAKAFHDKGIDCEFSALDAWTNEVKASVTDKAIKSIASNKKEEEFTRMSGIKESKRQGATALERLKEKYCK